MKTSETHLGIRSEILRRLIELGIEQREPLLRAQTEILLLAIEPPDCLAELGEGDVDAIAESANVVLGRERAVELRDVGLESVDAATEEVDFGRGVPDGFLVVERGWGEAVRIRKGGRAGRNALFLMSLERWRRGLMAVANAKREMVNLLM